MQQIIYKIVTRAQWREAQEAGEFQGAPVDLADGFIHFSTAEQVRETAARHFAGQFDLLLAGIDTAQIKQGLKWEVSRGGALFPHLYARLPMEAVISVEAIPLDEEGIHRFPAEIPI